MNLARECIQELSKLGWEELCGPIEAGMPRHFLLSTLQLRPALRPAAESIEEIAERLARPDGAEPWRNPEVYWQITRLAKSAEAAAEPEPTLETLRTQAGLIPPDEAKLPEGLHRLVCVDGGGVYRVRDGVRSRVEGEPVTEVDEFRGRVLLPYDGLFADMVEPRLYPPVADQPPPGRLRERLAAAFDLIAAYSGPLIDDIQEVVRLVVLTPDLLDDKRWSYNLRMAYFGAIFINPHPIRVYGTAESIIHEYCHQRLWQWWTYDPPVGLPAPELEVLSPVTGRMKPIQVMVHALVVYVLANDFYRWCLATGSGPREEGEWLGQRQKHLAQGIPRLHHTLSEEVEAGTPLQALLDHSLDRFESARE